MNQSAFEDELCARLLAQAQSLRRELASRAWEANLTSTDFLALRHMVRSSYASSPGEIARVLACSRSNATKVVQRLAAAGYVRTTTELLAPKAKSVLITPAGREAYARALRRCDPVNRFAQLSNEDRKELYRLLGLIGPRLPMSTPVG